jgi:hypothetical protein
MMRAPVAIKESCDQENGSTEQKRSPTVTVGLPDDLGRRDHATSITSSFQNKVVDSHLGIERNQPD